jgi:hypothetical protein
MKLGKALGAPIIVAHGGATHGEPPDVLMGRITERLERVAPKVEHLGVGLGLETAGREGNWGTLGDIALVASRFSFVRPVIDWAHIHAVTGGGLTSKEAFAQVLAFLTAEFPAWMIDPLHTQFTDNQVGDKGEVRHLPYGEGTLRVGPLVEAAHEADIRLVIISEAREEESHRAIAAEARAAAGRSASTPAARRIDSGKVDFPALVRAVPEGDRFRVKTPSPLTISNPDKLFFPDDGYTKGDIIQYYASVADVLILLLIGSVVTLFHGDWRWFLDRRIVRGAIAFVSISWVVTAVIEWWALGTGRWEYADTMITIGGVGLTPLLQWTLLPPLLLVIARRLFRSPVTF